MTEASDVAKTPLLSLRQAGVARKGHWIFKDLDLDLHAGDVIALTGRNGVGKTTALRAMAKLDRLSSGTLCWRGKPVAPGNEPAFRQDVGFVHQHPVLFSTSVEANIGYGLPKSLPARQARINDAMKWAGVEHLRPFPPRQLSGGEKQRVALARAKVRNPSVLLLDEPTSNLDGIARESVIHLILALKADGCAILFAGHDRDLIHATGAIRFKMETDRF